MIEKYAWFVVKNPLRIIAMLLLIALIPATGVRHLEFSIDYRDFFGGDDIHVKTFDDQQAIYSKVDNVLLVLEPSGNSVFTKEFLTQIEKATSDAWKIPYATRVDSITNFQNSHSKNDVLIVEDLVKNAGSLNNEQLELAKKTALSEPLLINKLIASGGELTAINITFHLPTENASSHMPVTVAAIRELAKKIESSSAVANVYLTGTVMINNAFFEIAKHDMVTLIPIMFLLIILLLSVLLRSIIGTLATFAVVGFANAVALGMGGYIGVDLTPPSAASAPIIMTLSIAACVHLILSYFRAYRKTDSSNILSKQNAMIVSIQSNFMPITLTSITTAIGFLTMNFADSPPFHDLGNLVAIGVVAAYVFTMFLLPALLMLTPISSGKNLPKDRKVHPEEKALQRFSEFVVQHHRTVLVVMCLFSVVIIFLIPKNELNDEFVKYFDLSVPFRQDNDFITENLTGVYLIDYSLSSGEEFGIHNPEYLKTLEAFGLWLESQPEVWHVQSMTDIYKKSFMNLNNGNQDFYRIPDTNMLAAQSLFAYELSLPIGLDINDRVSVDKSATKFTVSVRTISAKEMIDLELRAEQWLKNNAPQTMLAIGTGPAVLFAHIGMASIKAGLVGGFTALALISLILMGVFRSIKIGLLCLVPNMLPAALGFGVWALAYGKINMALATVISMTMGIVVDDTIHFINRYLNARNEKNMDARDAVKFAISHVGMAIIITTIVLIAGFLVLTFSPFAMNWGMGMLTALIIGFALLTDLLLLPPILIELEDTKNG